MIERNLTRTLETRATQYPVVAVTGPRQSGKTTLCQAVFHDRPYVSLEAEDVREYAKVDPRGFLGEYQDGAVLDEVQRAPHLLSYLQGLVDEDPTPGRFILTGSQHFGLSEAISQSLAGRVGILHLLPLALDELGRFDEHPSGLLEVLWAGAYPRIHDRGIPADVWLRDYFSTYIQRDVRQVLQVADLEAFATFMRLAAGRTGAEINLSGLGADAGIRHNTARSWLSVLETSFLITRVPAWHRNVRKQQIKAPKLHFLDSGLVCFLLGIRTPQELQHHPLKGLIFESWVVSEVFKRRVHQGLEPRLFHYREAQGLEVDLVVDLGLRKILGEVKAGATVNQGFFRPLQRLGDAIQEAESGGEIISRLVYGGEQGQRRTNIEIIPWSGMNGLPWE
jgi:predicted AAA+ superfamily ATPase